MVEVSRWAFVWVSSCIQYKENKSKYVLFCRCWQTDLFTHLQLKLCCLFGVPLFLNSSVNWDGEKKGETSTLRSAVYTCTPHAARAFYHSHTHHMSRLQYPLFSFCFLGWMFYQRAFLVLAWSSFDPSWLHTNLMFATYFKTTQSDSLKYPIFCVTHAHWVIWHSTVAYI